MSEHDFPVSGLGEEAKTILRMTAEELHGKGHWAFCTTVFSES
jgi:hypothetical protein